MKNKTKLNTSVLAGLLLSVPMMGYASCCASVVVSQTPVTAVAEEIATSNTLKI